MSWHRLLVVYRTNAGKPSVRVWKYGKENKKCKDKELWRENSWQWPKYTPQGDGDGLFRLNAQNDSVAHFRKQHFLNFQTPSGHIFSRNVHKSPSDGRLASRHSSTPHDQSSVVVWKTAAHTHTQIHSKMQHRRETRRNIPEDKKNSNGCRDNLSCFGTS